MRTRLVAARPYREVTPAGMTLGILTGIVLTVSFTYTGLVIGFVVPASAVAAILGWGLLRGVLRRGTIIENNINQTVAAAISCSCGGVIFTVPVLMLLGQPVPYGVLSGATIVGAALGVLFILPLRRQMIELDRLRFPTGTAVAQILRSPGAGLRKSALLGAGVIASAALSSLIGLPRLWPALPQLLPETVDLGRLLGLPGYMSHVWALSALSLGAGFLSGRAGLVVLLGGVLANWLLSPVLVHLRWAPPDGTVLFREINRPLGIGMLLGGALVGVAMAVPLLRGALAGLGRRGGGTSDELGLRSFVGAGLVGLLALWGLAQVGSAGLPPGQAALVALVGVVYIALSGIIIAQCTGLTDWSPMSGMALIAVSLIMLLSGHHVAVSVACGAACCVAMGQAADMMTDLKTGHLVGTRPRLQQLAQLSVAWMGPPVALGTLHLVARAYGLGTDRVPAPQAQALQAAMLGLLGGQAPVDRYLAGALLGGLLTAALGGGLGVMVGLSMYIPFQYILPYGLGCLLAMWAERRLGGRWCQDTGLPLAAGLIVGDSLAGVTLALLQVGRGLGAVVP
ncbi:MAG: OPT/YSL family transporter [Myxococcales bacterium]|nr:OPT/YSL family transporter [Myxococcales bacterium]